MPLETNNLSLICNNYSLQNFTQSYIFARVCTNDVTNLLLLFLCYLSVFSTMHILLCMRVNGAKYFFIIDVSKFFGLLASNLTSIILCLYLY